jgi:hypothetical protein
MTDVIVDTNVAVVANRQNPGVVTNCADNCVLFLTVARSEHVVLIDEGDEIRAEYASALRVSRPFQLGALFLLHIYQNQFNPAHVRRVELPKHADGSLRHFPTTSDLAAFDLSDRKFAALAAKTGVPVTNATDSDWADSIVALNAAGIAVDFLCGCDKTKWFSK